MKEEILSNLDNPAELEKLYRSDRTSFKRSFTALYPELKTNAGIEFWHQRLTYGSEDINWGNNRELIFLGIACLLAGIIAKLPAIFHLNEEIFYPRNVGFVVFPALIAFFAWKNKLSTAKIACMAAATLAGLVFINSLPDMNKSNTTILSCIHLLLFLWSILGFSFVGEIRNDEEKRLRFLKYNGDLVVMTTLIVIAGGILSGMTVGLFSLIGFNIEKFYFQNIVMFAVPSAPILGTYLTQTNPQLVGKVSPVIARIFSPLVLVMLVIYLVAMIFSGKNPYNNREFLLIFNGLLIGVMAIIFFSVAETSKAKKSPAEIWILFLLSALTIIVNCIALSAILFRISAFGMTPNRAAVLGGNGLILINLLFVTAQLFKVLSKKTGLPSVGKAIAFYLPVYFIWTIIVTFLFPLLFGFR